MKTKLKKQDEVKRGNELAKKSEALFLIDFAKLKTDDMKHLRRELTAAGNPLLVIKKRLLGIILKERGAAWDAGEFKTPVGTVFASNLESAAGAVYAFLKKLETEKKISSAGEKMLGGYDLKRAAPLEAGHMLLIGKLPPRKILLAQLLGMIIAPMRSLLYILDQKSHLTFQSNSGQAERS